MLKNVDDMSWQAMALTLDKFKLSLNFVSVAPGHKQKALMLPFAKHLVKVITAEILFG